MRATLQAPTPWWFTNYETKNKDAYDPGLCTPLIETMREIVARLELISIGSLGSVEPFGIVKRG